MEILRPARFYTPAYARCGCGATFALRQNYNICSECEAECDRNGFPFPPSPYRKRIAQALGREMRSYTENRLDGTIHLEYGNNTVTFDVLAQISQICGTRNINFSGATTEIDRSDITRDTVYEGELVISGVKFPET